MASVDASTLGDAERIRRTVLAERHSQALRMLRFQEEGGQDGVVDRAAVTEARKAVEAVEAEIQAEYADEPTEPVAEPPKGK